MTEFFDWVLAQPVAIAILLLVAVGFLTERIVPGATVKRERERADTLSAGLTKATDAAEKTLDTSRLLLSLIQGIDSTLRNRGP